MAVLSDCCNVRIGNGYTDNTQIGEEWDCVDLLVIVAGSIENKIALELWRSVTAFPCETSIAHDYEDAKVILQEAGYFVSETLIPVQ